MHEILEILRVPVVITMLSIISGVCTGLAAESGSSRALWCSASAVCLTGLSLASLAPDVTLAPSGVVLGFAVTAIFRRRRRRRPLPGGDGEK